MDPLNLFPIICYAPDDGTAPAAADTGSSAPAATTGTTVDNGGGGTPTTEADPRSHEDVIRDQLAAVWDKAHKNDATDLPDPDDDAPESAPVLRDEQGRFKSAKAPESAAASGATALEGEPNSDPDDPSEAGDDPDQPGEQKADGPQGATEMPRSWSKDKEAVWNELSPAAKAFVAQRDTELTQALSRAGRDVATLRNYEPVLAEIQPYEEYLFAVGKHIDMAPAKLIGQTLRFENLLRTSDNDGKLAVLKDIVAEYDIDISPIFGTEANTAMRQGAVAHDPRVAQLEQRVAELTTHLTAEQQRQQDALNAELDQTIAAFKADPKYKYHAEVWSHMAQLLKADLAKDLPDAYEQAVWANPKTRARIQQDQQGTVVDPRQTEAVRTAKAANGVNVKSGVPSPAKRTARADMEAVAKKHYG